MKVLSFSSRRAAGARARAPWRLRRGRRRLPVGPGGFPSSPCAPPGRAWAGVPAQSPAVVAALCLSASSSARRSGPSSWARADALGGLAGAREGFGVFASGGLASPWRLRPFMGAALGAARRCRPPRVRRLRRSASAWLCRIRRWRPSPACSPLPRPGLDGDARRSGLPLLPPRPLAGLLGRRVGFVVATVAGRLRRRFRLVAVGARGISQRRVTASRRPSCAAAV